MKKKNHNNIEELGTVEIFKVALEHKGIQPNLIPFRILRVMPMCSLKTFQLLIIQIFFQVVLHIFFKT